MKKIYLLPNCITSINLLCGFLALLAAFHHAFEQACWYIIAAGVCDMLDGRIARLAKATSHFGIEYDSLSDLLSFGVAPACIAFVWAFEQFGKLGSAVAFLFLACGALRLARFNVGAANAQPSFQGLPIPIAAAVVMMPLLVSVRQFGIEHPDRLLSGIYASWFVITAGLMVSSIPFPSFKKLHWRSRASAGLFLVGLASISLCTIMPDVALCLLFVGYTLGGILYYLLGRATP